MDKKTWRIYQKKQARDCYCNWYNCIQSLSLEESPTYTKSSWVAYKDKVFDLKILSNRYQVRYMKISTFELGLYYYAIFMHNTARKQESRPRSCNELGLPHPRRPRGSQSGQEKRREESFQVRAKEPLGTDSRRTISKNWSGCRLLIEYKKFFVLLCPIGEHISWVLFVRSCTTAIVSRLVWLMYQRNARSQETFSFIWFQNTVCPKTKDAFPKIQASAYNRYSRLHRPCLA